MSRHGVNMFHLARRYCALIETSSSENPSWLKDVAELLPKLHAAVNCLNGHDYKANSAFAADLDARFELYMHLVEVLGDRDSYWLEFDRVDESDTMTGSLADDLTDIYCELKRGLAKVDAGLDAGSDGGECLRGRPETDPEADSGTDCSARRAPERGATRESRHPPNGIGRWGSVRTTPCGDHHPPPAASASSGPDPVVASVHQAWRESFAYHWGRHLIDATRHLSVLDAEGRLG